jgi:hypothetical protein
MENWDVMILRMKKLLHFCTNVHDFSPGRLKILLRTSGFWPRVRARALRAPVFFRLINMQNGALRAPPPIAASLLLIYTPKLSLGPELGQSGVRIYFHWAKLHPPELHCILLSYTPYELHST